MATDPFGRDQIPRGIVKQRILITGKYITKLMHIFNSCHYK